MANLAESATYDAGVYQLEVTDAVVGGAGGVANAAAKNLANRTTYLKEHVDAIEADYVTGTDLAAHVAAADPHPQYLRESDAVSQAEAEAGASATVRAWSALRVKQAIQALVPVAKRGLTISNNAVDSVNDIDIAAGYAMDASDTVKLAIGAVLTKRLDAAWAVGSGNGGLFSGAKANSTWYHVFLIRKDADGSIDVGFDTSITAANKPDGYSSYRRLGSIVTDAAGTIRPFNQFLNLFLFKTPVLDMSAVAISTVSTNYTISTPPGIKCLAKLFLTLNGNESGIYVRDPDAADLAPAFPNNLNFGVYSSGTTETVAGELSIVTNTASQFAIRRDSTACNLTASTHGWTDFGV